MQKQAQETEGVESMCTSAVTCICVWLSVCIFFFFKKKLMWHVAQVYSRCADTLFIHENCALLAHWPKFQVFEVDVINGFSLRDLIVYFIAWSPVGQTNAVFV